MCENKPTENKPTFERFPCWAALLDHIDAGKPTFYHAPMDQQPVLVACKVLRVKSPNGRAYVKVTPNGKDEDPFRCDSGHLDRFRKRA